jgi:hypothetical protein
MLEDDLRLGLSLLTFSKNTLLPPVHKGWGDVNRDRGEGQILSILKYKSLYLNHFNKKFRLCTGGEYWTKETHMWVSGVGHVHTHAVGYEGYTVFGEIYLFLWGMAVWGSLYGITHA